jgi:formate hydrogenlyase transcriptional activator
MDADTSRRYEILLAVADSIGRHRDLTSLFRHLAEILRGILPFEYLLVALYDESTETVRHHTLVSSRPLPPHALDTLPLDASGAAWVIRTQQRLVLHNAAERGNPLDVRQLLEDTGIKGAVFLPLTTAVRRTGAIGFGSTRAGAYDDEDLDFVGRVAAQVAVAVDNARHSDLVARQAESLARDRDRWRVLLEVNNALVATLDLQELLTALTPRLRTVIPFDAAFIALHDEREHALRLVAREMLGAPPRTGSEPTLLPLTGTALGEAFSTGRPLLVNQDDWHRIDPASAEQARRVGVRSGCAIPLTGPRQRLGAFVVASHDGAAFAQADVDLLVQVGVQMGIAIENALSYQRVADLGARLEHQNRYLEHEIRSTGHYDHIIGAAAGLRDVMRQVESVAATDSTVLILGETGTGKELVARAIHDASPRRDRTFVRVNCAAIPSGLLESELFGHEKGAFTGALMRKIGRFELADGGTILLDEVGDIPLELQPKLLRVLQEHEFERLGNARSTKVDVRVLAATNRDLQAMVEGRLFRPDLFYRLNVFPISLPALRERRDDVPSLVEYFTHRHAGRLKRTITRIPPETMASLQRWSWPGNVRELENVIERAVILSRGEVLEVPMPVAAADAGPVVAPASDPAPAALESVERAHILRTLRETHWVIGGPAGAAHRLGMKRTTLTSRMRKLGLVRPVPE